MSTTTARLAQRLERSEAEAQARASARERRIEIETERERARREARRRMDAEARGSIVVPEILTLRQRLARPEPPISWRIESWQPRDSRIVLAAQFKAGKTTLVGGLARSLVDGDPWLDRYRVSAIDGTVILFDTEMSARQLDAWLRAQRIRADDRVLPIPLRGQAASLDLRDDTVRAAWATRLRDWRAQYVILDCLRPVLDALGLDEHHDAGRYLVAFDALLREAAIGDALIVHHMGHAGERSRGDSRLRDWPDAEWRLVRERDDPASTRYLTAYGRDVDVSETALDYDTLTRRLTIAGGSRRDAAVRDTLAVVLGALRKAGRALSGRELELATIECASAAGSLVSRRQIQAAITAGECAGSIRTRPGPRRAKLHAFCEISPECASAPECATSAPAQSGSECASVPPLYKSGALSTLPASQEQPEEGRSHADGTF